MGYFDPATQRRSGQQQSCALLPAREVLGAEAEPADLSLPKVYKTLAAGLDYLPQNALLAFSDTGRLADRAKSYHWQLGEDVKTLLEQGLLSGKDCTFAKGFEALCQAGAAPRTLLYLDAFTTGNLPVPPRFLLSLTARQLPGSGVNFEAMVEDLQAYQRQDFAVVVLTASRRKADALQGMLREKKIHSAVDEHLHALPEPGRITIAVGDLSAGFDYPDGHFAVLAEGAPPPQPRQRRRTSSSV